MYFLLPLSIYKNNSQSDPDAAIDPGSCSAVSIKCRIAVLCKISLLRYRTSVLFFLYMMCVHLAGVSIY